MGWMVEREYKNMKFKISMFIKRKSEDVGWGGLEWATPKNTHKLSLVGATQN
jgi:hypothetical protein